MLLNVDKHSNEKIMKNTRSVKEFLKVKLIIN